MTTQSNAMAQANAPVFDIVINYSGDPAYQQYFNYAAKMWELIIKGDVSDQNVAGVGFVDDLYIDASAVAIDGAGGTLGQAGPDVVRANNITTTGSMQFDTADLAGLVADGSLNSTILHEMGHVLGLGTLWENVNLVTLIPDGTKPFGINYHYTGVAAVAEYRLLSGNSGATFIQVESDQGDLGTVGGHWDENIFGLECMTGFIDAGLNPISRMTIASLRDLGYVVDLGAADAFSLASTPVAYRDDFSGNYNTSTTIAVGGTQNGVIELNEDNDWFQVNLVAGTSYTFTMKGSYSGVGTLTDAFLRLHALDGEILAFNDNNSSSTESTFAFTATTTGLYYLDGAAAGTQTGTYQIGLSVNIPGQFTEGNDNITLPTASAPWHALGGDDTIVGSGIGDIVYGDSGHDHFYIAGGGSDQIFGGAGFDYVHYDGGSAATVSLVVGAVNSGSAVGDVLDTIEGVVGSYFGDTITGDGNANILYGLDGIDTINGGGGNDVLYGGNGADILVGGTGNDLYEIDNVGDVITEVAGAANGIADNAYTYVDYTLATGVDNLIMLYGNQRYGTGNAADNIIYGNAQLNVLQGGAGYDTLIGGAGSDYYIVNAGFGVDVITDFIAGAGTQDAIVFSKSLFTTFAGVISHAAQVGADTWIGDGFGNTVVLSNVLKTSLHADDFQFA